MSLPHREFVYLIDFSRFFNTPEGITTEETYSTELQVLTRQRRFYVIRKRNCKHNKHLNLFRKYSYIVQSDFLQLQNT